MIAAVLTCVFVIYLYRKLNTDPGSASGNDKNGPNDLTVLASRLATLEDRLKRLADLNSTQEVQS